MVIEPKVRGFICITTHPTGCEENVKQQIAYVKEQGKIENGPKSVLVIGASTGYGLASRISAAFGCKAATLGVFFEKAGSEKRPGTAGWYNTAAFTKFAREEGLLCGISSGTNVAAAIKLAKKLGPGKTVVTVLPDTAERYFSTPLFEE